MTTAAWIEYGIGMVVLAATIIVWGVILTQYLLWKWSVK